MFQVVLLKAQICTILDSWHLTAVEIKQDESSLDIGSSGMSVLAEC